MSIWGKSYADIISQARIMIDALNRLGSASEDFPMGLGVTFIDELTTNFPIDKEHITLVGFSQGSILSYAVALSNPEKIQQVAALSGYIHESIFAKDFDKKDFSNLRIFASHGSVDQVIPVQWARLVQPFLEKLKINIEYREYNVGHGVAPQNFADFKNWLQRK